MASRRVSERTEMLEQASHAARETPMREGKKGRARLISKPGCEEVRAGVYRVAEVARVDDAVVLGGQPGSLHRKVETRGKADDEEAVGLVAVALHSRFQLDLRPVAAGGEQRRGLARLPVPVRVVPSVARHAQAELEQLQLGNRAPGKVDVDGELHAVTIVASPIAGVALVLGLVHENDPGHAVRDHLNPLVVPYIVRELDLEHGDAVILLQTHFDRRLERHRNQRARVGVEVQVRQGLVRRRHLHHFQRNVAQDHVVRLLGDVHLVGKLAADGLHRRQRGADHLVARALGLLHLGGEQDRVAHLHRIQQQLLTDLPRPKLLARAFEQHHCRRAHPGLEFVGAVCGCELLRREQRGGGRARRHALCHAAFHLVQQHPAHAETVCRRRRQQSAASGSALLAAHALHDALAQLHQLRHAPQLVQLRQDPRQRLFPLALRGAARRCYDSAHALRQHHIIMSVPRDPLVHTYGRSHKGRTCVTVDVPTSSNTSTASA
eukprot:890305-Rhodomonas_salina.2